MPPAAFRIRRADAAGSTLLPYAVVIALTVYTFLDLDYPRFGLVRLKAADNPLLQLHDSIR